MHPDAETRILSLALPLEEPNRSAFIKAASEAARSSDRTPMGRAPFLAACAARSNAR